MYDFSIFQFSILLVLIFILELAAGISGYVLKGETQDLLKKSLTNTMADYGNKDHVDITVAWDTVQLNVRIFNEYK